MLLELAIGDAYGAGFEYVSTQLIRAYNDLQQFVIKSTTIRAI